MKLTYHIFILFIVICHFPVALFAQKDTTKKQIIDITSSYKPVLRNAVKINFSATNLNADTTKQKLQYSIPAQNLFYTYRPVSLKPLAFEADQSLLLGDRNFVKAGFGNYSTPYVKAGLSFGDGKKVLANLYGDYISSKGKIDYQDYSQLHLKATGSYFLPKNEVYGAVGFNQDIYYLYGYDHNLYKYSKDTLRQQFQDLGIKIGFRNTTVNETGINYNPTLQFNVFNNQNRLSETTLAVDLPVEKTINDIFTIKVVGKGSFTTYKTKELPVDVKVKNNLFQLAPELIYATSKLTIHGGVTPSWNNDKLNVLPNIYGEWMIKQGALVLQAGWVGQYVKNSYRYLSSVNPYLATITSQNNTREVEFYGGVKATLGKHFNFSAKTGFINYHDMPLFINDTATDDKAFLVKNESKAKNVRIHADMSYISQDKFTITGGFTVNGYTGLVDNSRAWGTVPLEIDASMRWWAFKKVLLKSDLVVCTGGPYVMKGNIEKSLSSYADLSAGAEFAITKKISAWLDINNILNNKYERWHNYETYGLNFLIGAIYKF